MEFDAIFWFRKTVERKHEGGGGGGGSEHIPLLCAQIMASMEKCLTVDLDNFDTISTDLARRILSQPDSHEGWPGHGDYLLSHKALLEGIVLAILPAYNLRLKGELMLTCP